jgi:hypothetical protein
MQGEIPMTARLTRCGATRAAGICLLAALGISVSVMLAPSAAAAPGDGAKAAAQNQKRTKSRHAAKRRPSITVKRWTGYGFLPGYTPPEKRYRPPAKTYHYWYGRTWDGYNFGPYGTGGYGGMWYRGHWTNGLGPCWTRTPIGPMWNCG